MKLLSLTIVVFLIRVQFIGVMPQSLGYLLVGIMVFGIGCMSVLGRRRPSYLNSVPGHASASLLAIAAISTIVAVLNGFGLLASLLAFLKIGILVSVLYLGFLAGNSINSSVYIKLILLSIFVHVLLGVALVPFGYVQEVHDIRRVIGFSESVQGYANVTLILFVYSAVLLFGTNAASIPRRNLYLFFALTVIAMILSITLKNLATAIFVLVLLFLRDLKRNIGVVIAIAAVLGIASPLLISFFSDSDLYYRLVVIWEAGLDTNLAVGEKLESSVVWRLLHWQKLIEDWTQNYLLFGAGIGQSEYMQGLKMLDGRGFEAHSDFVMFLVEFGLILSIPLFLILKTLLWRPIVLYGSTGNGNFKAIYMCSVALVIASTFGNVFYSLACLYYLWFLIGWCEGKHLQETRDAE